jgi:hypothetical protein
MWPLGQSGLAVSWRSKQASMSHAVLRVFRVLYLLPACAELALIVTVKQRYTSNWTSTSAIRRATGMLDFGQQFHTPAS